MDLDGLILDLLYWGRRLLRRLFERRFDELVIDVTDLSDDVELLIGSSCLALLDLYLIIRDLKCNSLREFLLLPLPRRYFLDGMQTIGGKFIGLHFVIEAAHYKIND